MTKSLEGLAPWLRMVMCEGFIFNGEREKIYAWASAVEAIIDAPPAELLTDKTWVMEMHSLRAVLCGIGIVGQIDGYDVIRRDSAIELIDRYMAYKEIKE